MFVSRNLQEIVYVVVGILFLRSVLLYDVHGRQLKNIIKILYLISGIQKPPLFSSLTQIFLNFCYALSEIQILLSYEKNSFIPNYLGNFTYKLKFNKHFTDRFVN